MHVLLMSGSTRTRSTNTAVLRSAGELAPAGVTTELVDLLADLPAFNPDDDHDPLPAPVIALRGGLGRADAVLICTPEYAGGLPGSFKNLLDWSVGGPELAGMPVGWLNVSSVAAPTGGADAHASLATVLGYVAAVVVAGACVRAPMTRAAVTAGGTVADPDVRAAVTAALTALRDHVG